jgi:hypothetical protein
MRRWKLDVLAITRMSMGRIPAVSEELGRLEGVGEARRGRNSGE